MKMLPQMQNTRNNKQRNEVNNRTVLRNTCNSDKIIIKR